jgi:hypothetical protein
LSGLTAGDIIVIEIFCGTAGVTASFKRHGFSNAIAVAKTKQAGMLAGVISLDLTSLADQILVLQWLEHPISACCFLSSTLWHGKCCKVH